MKEYLKCRACGYIIDKDGAPDICPACGVGSKAFEDYRYNVSEWRRIVMAVDIHPIMLHVPQAISGLIPFFVLLSYLFYGTATVKLLDAVEVLTYILPLSVVAAFFTGMFDGYNRFRKLDTPALISKMIRAIVLFGITCVMLYIVYSRGVEGSAVFLAILSVAALAVEVSLSRIGIKLMYAYMPGK